MRDTSFDEAAVAWSRECAAWADGSHEDLQDRPYLKEEYPYYWQYTEPPRSGGYRPNWTPEEATCWQIYSTVDEGQPVSPVFASVEEMIAWMTQPNDTGDDLHMQGLTREQAERFVQVGHAPSAIMIPGKGLLPGFRALTDDGG